MSDQGKRGVIDRVKSDARDDTVLVEKSPHEDLSIGTQLIVNQSQEALLVKDGVALDLFGPGRHTLATDNIPLIRNLVNLPFGGRTPFTAEVWFINKTAKRDLTWGTATPIQIQDPKTGVFVQMRAYGTWGLRVADSRVFVSRLVGSQLGADSDKVYSYFAGEITQRLSSVLTSVVVDDRVSVLEVNARLSAIAGRLEQELKPEFARFGLEVVNFNVMRVSIPPEEFKRLQDMSMFAVNERYYGAARGFDTLEKAAANQGQAGSLLAGGLAAGFGLGAGLPLGQRLGETVAAPSPAPTPAPPPPPPTAPSPAAPSSTAGDPGSRLRRLKELADGGLISAEDYEKKKLDILADL